MLSTDSTGVERPEHACLCPVYPYLQRFGVHVLERVWALTEPPLPERSDSQHALFPQQGM